MTIWWRVHTCINYAFDIDRSLLSFGEIDAHTTSTPHGMSTMVFVRFSTKYFSLLIGSPALVTLNVGI